jgi:carboxypeptidase Taq
MNSSLEKLYSRSSRIHSMIEIQQLLDWDQQVMMPRQGAVQRANQMAAVAATAHEWLIDPSLLELIREIEETDDLDDNAKADIREAKRACQRAARVPQSLVVERAKTCTLAQSAWEQARADDDFQAFLPHLDKVVALTRETADALGGECRYDALLEEFEPGASTQEVRELFAELRSELVGLLDRILGSSRIPDGRFLAKSYPLEGQRELCLRMARDMGYDFEAGRLDVSAHPFTTGTLRDVRITTRYQEQNLATSIFGTLHEVGHALYEQDLDPERYDKPGGVACSLGVHESQSRFWENVVGRSKPFWAFYFPVLRDTFPGILDGTGTEDFYRAVNRVSRSPIRVEADEVTYNLHIVLRFELEVDLMEERLSTADLPDAWNQKMKEFLGIEPENDAQGVLQDIHWSAGAIGYFPTYTLGNLYAAQFATTIRNDLEDFDGLIEGGNLLPIKNWLAEHIHRKGLLLQPQDLCRKVTGSPLSIRPAMDYLKNKYSEIYGL